MKRKSIIWIILTTILVLSLFIWTIVSTLVSHSVTFGGSTSINLLMSKLTSLYKKTDKQEVLYHSTGSQNGLTNAQNGQFVTGFISKEIKENDLRENYFWNKIENNQDLVDKEEEFDNIVNDLESSDNRNGFNAVQIATDAIVIVFNPPKWMDQKTINQINLDLNKEEDKQIVEDIYTEDNFTWKKLLEKLNVEIPDNAGDEKIQAVVRESGSGTRDAFEHLFGIKKPITKPDTVSSNGAMLQKINDNKNTLGYISYGNLDKIQQGSEIQLVGINNWKLAIKNRDGHLNALKYNENSHEWEKDEKTNEQIIKNKEYKLSRPFIGLFKTNYKNWKIARNFYLNLFIKQNSDSDELFRELGLIKEFKFLNKNIIGD